MKTLTINENDNGERIIVIDGVLVNTQKATVDFNKIDSLHKAFPDSGIPVTVAVIVKEDQEITYVNTKEDPPSASLPKGFHWAKVENSICKDRWQKTAD